MLRRGSTRYRHKQTYKNPFSGLSQNSGVQFNAPWKPLNAAIQCMLQAPVIAIPDLSNSDSYDNDELESRLFPSGDSAASTTVNVVVATSSQVKVIAFNIILFFFYCYLKFRSVDGFQCFLRLISDQDPTHTIQFLFVFDVVFIIVC
jgi:hypothetical protein